ncbi:MAG: hypothetical protein ACR2PT_00895 [Endozoicomonas sp.]
MQFYTDDHRQIQLAKPFQQPNGIIPKPNDPNMRRLMDNHNGSEKKQSLTEPKLKS